MKKYYSKSESESTKKTRAGIIRAVTWIKRTGLITFEKLSFKDYHELLKNIKIPVM